MFLQTHRLVYESNHLSIEKVGRKKEENLNTFLLLFFSFIFFLNFFLNYSLANELLQLIDRWLKRFQEFRSLEPLNQRGNQLGVRMEVVVVIRHPMVERIQYTKENEKLPNKEIKCQEEEGGESFLPLLFPCFLQSFLASFLAYVLPFLPPSFLSCFLLFHSSRSSPCPCLPFASSLP